MYPDDFIPPKSVADFCVKNDEQFIPPISFTMRVIATDVPSNHSDFKIKILLDFAPEFTTECSRDNHNFSGKGVRRILNFVSDKVLPKVLESVYYDVSNGAISKSDQYANSKDSNGLPPGYADVMKVYENRRKTKNAKRMEIQKKNQEL